MKSKIASCCTALWLVSLSGAAFSQQISEVVFEQDPNNSFFFSDDLLFSQIQSRKGSKYSERNVNDDVKRLYAKGYFSDVVSVVEIQPDGSRRVIFRITPKPLVSLVVFKGNKKYSDEVLSKMVHLPVGYPLNDAQLKQSLDELRRFYTESEGLTDSNISFKIVKDAPEEQGSSVHVEFIIEEGLRVRVNSVQFRNAEAFDVAEMRNAIATRYSLFSSPWLSWLPLQAGAGLLSTEILEQDKVRLKELYWRKGYLDFTVKDIQLVQKDKPELVDVIFVVDEGEPYQIGNISISGAARFSEDEIRQVLTQKSGDTYNVLLEQQDIDAVSGMYAPLGYDDFYAYVVRNPNYETHTVDLEYRLSEGQPYTIGKVYVSGNRFTKYPVIMRETLLQEGDPVDREKIEISKQRLLGMGYFGADTPDPEDGVSIITANAAESGKKDVYIEVQENRFITGRIGATASDTDGIAGMFELTHSNMDLFDPENYFTGGGQRARLSAIVGTESMDFSLDFTEPWLFGVPLRLDYSTYYHETRYDDWDESRLGLTVSLSKNIFDEFTSVTGGYTFELVRIMDMAHKMSYKFKR